MRPTVAFRDAPECELRSTHNRPQDRGWDGEIVSDVVLGIAADWPLRIGDIGRPDHDLFQRPLRGFAIAAPVLPTNRF
jgi:hypothetical protein